MSWRCLSFSLDASAVDALSDALLASGALSVDVSDAAAGAADEEPVFAEPGLLPARWSRNRVSALFDAGTDATAVLARACASSGVPVPEDVIASEVADLDWVRLTQSQFGPIRISDRLWIVPTWEQIPDPDAVNLVLDPGVAFGTGSHPTTRLCLQWLDANLLRGQTVLDYGCGSGILAIAALKLGASRAGGVDIDPQAVLAARANAVQNLVAADFHAPGDESRTPVDVVLANILANPLIALAPLLAAASRPGGIVVLSGVLEEQADEVCAAYGQWFDMRVEGLDEGWVLLTGKKAR
jgi:ribosomal protein L11 methyltransferase